MEFIEDDDDDKAERAEERASEKRKSRLNAVVAVTVALLATFMGICKVKDDNIVQAMQQAQADKIDQWNFYQARNIREEVMRSTAETLRLQAATVPPAQRALFLKQSAQYTAMAKSQEKKKKEQADDAKKADDTYNALNTHDDQFDLSDALLSLALSLMALTALTQKRWLFFVALVPTALGVFMGICGLFGLGFHPDRITSLLS